MSRNSRESIHPDSPEGAFGPPSTGNSEAEPLDPYKPKRRTGPWWRKLFGTRHRKTHDHRAQLKDVSESVAGDASPESRPTRSLRGVFDSFTDHFSRTPVESKTGELPEGAVNAVRDRHDPETNETAEEGLDTQRQFEQELGYRSHRALARDRGSNLFRTDRKSVV